MPDTSHVKRKIVLIGDPAVGKTSLVRRYVLDVFSDSYITTVGTKVTRKELYFKDKEGSDIELTLMIWDVMGQKNDDPIPEKIFQGSKGAIMVCDLTREETLLNLIPIYKTLTRMLFNLSTVCVGNKCDLDDQIKFEKSKMVEILPFENDNYFITSAKTGDNVEAVFRELGVLMLKEQGIIVN